MARSTASENEEATSAEGLRRKSPLFGRDPSGSQIRIAAVTSLACARTTVLLQFQNCDRTALIEGGCVLHNHSSGPGMSRFAGDMETCAGAPPSVGAVVR